MELNNREIATIIWAGLVLLWMLSRADLRPSLWGVVRAFAQPRILATLGAFIAWIVGCVWLADRLGLWESSLVNEAVYWFLATGFVLYFSVTRISKEEDFLWQAARRALTLGLLAELFVNLIVMPLWAELVFVPVITLLVMTQVYAESNEEFAPAKKLLDWIVGLIGLGLCVFVVGSLIADPDQLDLAHLARLLALPVWLTVLSLPFIYALGLWATYEQAFTRINFFAKEKTDARNAKRAMIKRFHLRLRRVREFNGRWQRQLVEAVAAGESQRVLSEFQQERKANA